MELPLGTSGRDPLAVAREASTIAEALVREHFGRVSVTAKGNRNVVTEADVAVERAVRALLDREYPGMAILAEEESSGAWSSGWMWVCDPIDGTKNFSQGIPHFGFSIALCHDGQPQAALTSQPLLGWEVAAAKGRGCAFNGAPVRVSGRSSLDEAVVALDLGYDSAAGLGQLRLALAAWPAPQGVRICGSATLGFAYVAAGLWDVYAHSDLSPWDVAAGILLVEEAGGAVTARDGSPCSLRSRAAVAGTPAVHAALLNVARESDGDA